MIFSHSWEGEPHNSPSVKRLMKFGDPYYTHEWMGEPNNSPSIRREVWPGDPEYTYKWEGEVGKSPSLKYKDGELVARNLSNASAQVDDEYSNISIEYTQELHSYMSKIETQAGSTPYVGLTRMGVVPGEYFASGVDFRWGEGIGRVRHQIQFRGPNNESINAPQIQRDRVDYPEGGRSIFVERVPSGATEARIYTWFYLEGAFTEPPAGSTIHIGGYVNAVGSTEEEARLQVEESFDGDTKKHRGRIVSWNPLSSKSREIDKVWLQVTPPPSGTSYEWAGEPHASESIKRVDGVEVARNPNILSDRIQGIYAELSNVNGTVVATSTTDTDSSALPRFQCLTISGGALPVTPGGEYRLRAEVRHLRGLPIHIETWPLTADGSSTTPRHRSENISSTEWIEVSVSGTVPENAAYMGWQLRVDSSTTEYGSTYKGDVFEARHFAPFEEYFDGDTPSDRDNDLWYNADGVPHEWVNGQGWVVLEGEPSVPISEDFIQLSIESHFDGETPSEYGKIVARNRASNPRMGRFGHPYPTNSRASWVSDKVEVEDHPLGIDYATRTVPVDPTRAVIASLYNVGGNRVDSTKPTIIGFWIKTNIEAIVNNAYRSEPKYEVEAGEWEYHVLINPHQSPSINVIKKDLLDPHPNPETLVTGVVVLNQDDYLHLEEGQIIELAKYFFDGDTKDYGLAQPKIWITDRWVPYTPTHFM